MRQLLVEIYRSWADQAFGIEQRTQTSPYELGRMIGERIRCPYLEKVTGYHPPLTPSVQKATYCNHRSQAGLKQDFELARS